VLKGGVGTASTVLDNGVTVGAIVVVNSAGEVLDPTTGLPWMADLARQGVFAGVGKNDPWQAYASRLIEAIPKKQ
jgi:L-aminopeptidase/D-esterase-like protein